MAAVTAPPASLTAVILTRDEERHIGRALRSIRPLAQRIVVVDSGSQDRTREIARDHGAEIFERAWINYADQFQWAIDNCGLDTDWILRLDADEWLGEGLVADLLAILPDLPDETTAISLDRRQYFLGRWIRHGGRYPLRLLRIWRNGLGRIEQRWMDEHILVEKGTIRHVEGEFVDENDHGLGYFTAKHNAYATREAIDALISKYELFPVPEDCGLASTAQAQKMRKRKVGWYNRLPLGIGPMAYFLYRYIPKLGFLDGREGFIYHVLQGFWYRFLVDAKRFELEREIAPCRSRREKIDRLTAITGHDLIAFADNENREIS
ncbi:glycosyltransferase family 2 protein [Erythrobacter litoralis]|uniref:SpsA-like protein n=1 Tax=Erythrobacter litoralis (strain HTCC2594) TaxID=314225 RepID=Q2N705_ERYLH|nr:glycosyltransferase family 2 protein [Erythrobacter litoralis]ABC64536.1 spsA-like protein [Erythrobacter litoralis HTCC2594]